MRTRAVKLITFDVTGTLLKFEPPIGVRYAETARKFGIQADPGEIMRNFKQQYKALSKQHPNFGKSTGLGWNSWWAQIVVLSFKKVAPETEEKLLSELAKCLIGEYQTGQGIALVNGAEDLLTMLSRKNIPIGVISNYDERLKSILASLKIHPFFEFVVDSYTAGVMKPEKAIFDYALSQVKWNPDPQYCLHVGNSVDMDYAGARAAGWNAVLVNISEEKGDKDVDQAHIFQDLHHLRKYLESK